MFFSWNLDMFAVNGKWIHFSDDSPKLLKRLGNTIVKEKSKVHTG